MKRFLYSLFIFTFAKFKGNVEYKYFPASKDITIKGDLYIRKFSPISHIILLLVHLTLIKSIFEILFQDKTYCQKIKIYFNEPLLDEINQKFSLIDGTSSFRKKLTIFCLKYT